MPDNRPTTMADPADRSATSEQDSLTDRDVSAIGPSEEIPTNTGQIPLPMVDPASLAADGAGPDATPPVSTGRGLVSVIALAVGIFALVTIEELPIGVLSVMAPDLGVSEGIAGLTVTLPGVVAAIVALTTPVITRGLDRRTVLLIALGAVSVSSLLAVFSPGIIMLLVARLFAGIAIGMYWAVLPVVAVRQLPPEKSALALTITFSGSGGALVFGVPLVSWIGTHMGWRQAFVVVGVLALVLLVLVRLLVRPTRTGTAAGMSDVRAASRVRGVRFAIAFTALIITGHFISYSYVSPLLDELAGVPATSLSGLLLMFGLAGLVGNFAATPIIRRSPGVAVLLVACGMAVSVLALIVVVRTPVSAAVLMPFWGLYAGAASVCIQSFVTSEAGEYEETGTGLNSAMFNLSIALGALIGGRVVDGISVGAAPVASLVLVGIGILLAVRWLATPSRRH